MGFCHDHHGFDRSRMWAWPRLHRPRARSNRRVGLSDPPMQGYQPVEVNEIRAQLDQTRAQSDESIV